LHNGRYYSFGLQLRSSKAEFISEFTNADRHAGNNELDNPAEKGFKIRIAK
jgi:hypothetical protein